MKILYCPWQIYAFIINRICAFSSKIPQRVRLCLMNVAIVSLNLLGIIGHLNEAVKEYVHYYDLLFPLASASLVLLVIAGIEKKVARNAVLEHNPLFCFGWYVCFIAMIISGVIITTKEIYFLWSVLSLTVFPMIMIIYNDRIKLNKLFSFVAHHMVIASYFFLLINLLFVAFFTNSFFADGLGSEYLGLAPNPNSNGLIVLPFFSSALYLTITKNNNKAYYIFSMLICIMFTFISKTRTAELAMILEVLCAGVLVIRNKGLLKWELKAIKTISIIVVSLAITIVIGHCLLYIDKVDLNVYAEGEIEESYADIYGHENLIRLNQLSNGRLILWKAYLKRVSFVGHGNPDGPLFEGYEYSKWAHNNAIDIWYASGFIAFAGYIVWLLAAWGFVIRCLLKKDGFRKEYLLTVLAFIGYFVEAMLEITIYPMQTGVVLLCFLTITPIAFKNSADSFKDKHNKEPVYLDGERHYE